MSTDKLVCFGCGKTCTEEDYYHGVYWCTECFLIMEDANTLIDFIEGDNE